MLSFIFQNTHLNIAPSKDVFKYCYHKDIFYYSASINFLKGKIDINKSLIMYSGPILAINY